MSEETDFYALLGVGRNASDAELKKAYRGLARELHPDTNPDPEAERRFKQVTLAYEVLRDPERRARYDQFGIDGVRGAGTGGATGDPFANFGFGGDMNLGDIFDAFFGGGGFTGGRRQGSGPPPGPDIETRVVVDLEQAVFGAEVEVEIRVPVACETCSGSGAKPGTVPITCTGCKGQGEVRRVRQSILGQMVTSSPCQRCSGTGQQIESLCDTCRGEGRVTAKRAHTVQVPAGIDRGQTLRVTGKGGIGPRGGNNGDLYVHIDVHPHDRFVRDGFDLLHEMHVSMTQAALGAVLALDTLDEPVSVHLDAGTQTGKTVKFRGKGVHHINGRGRGDLIVHLVVDTPAGLDATQEELLRRLAAMRDEKVADADHGLLAKFKDAFR